MHSIIKLPSAAASQLTVTSTAQTLEQLITAAAGSDFTFANEMNALDMQVETNTVRYLADGNTPTGSVGFLLDANGVSFKSFRGEDIKKLKLIRGGASDATVNIQIGKITV